MITRRAEILPGFRHWPQMLDTRQQQALSGAIRAIVAEAPLFVPEMPKTGTPMSVRMTNCGPLGWVTDRDRGYRYQSLHPVTAKPWPPIPPILLELWERLADWPHPPEACLVNFYGPDARMGMHQDRDEADLSAPVLSVSLGDDAMFRIGGTARGGASTGIRLVSGDVLLLAGESRMAFHGVSRIYPGTSPLLRAPGRINLTLRRVTRP